jgi:peptidoglycan/LPS O-acetylase OafA/YrhL
MNLIFSATLAVDTFFLLSGFLMSYLMLKNLDKTKGRNQITQILFGYVHRYIRLALKKIQFRKVNFESIIY